MLYVAQDNSSSLNMASQKFRHPWLTYCNYGFLTGNGIFYLLVQDDIKLWEEYLVFVSRKHLILLAMNCYSKNIFKK